MSLFGFFFFLYHSAHRPIRIGGMPTASATMIPILSPLVRQLQPLQLEEDEDDESEPPGAADPVPLLPPPGEAAAEVCAGEDATEEPDAAGPPFATGPTLSVTVVPSG